MFLLVSQSNTAIFEHGGKRLRIGFATPSIARITYTEDKPFQETRSSLVVAEESWAEFQFQEDEDCFELRTAALTVCVDKQTSALAYWSASGRLLMQEPQGGGKSLVPKAIYRNIFRKDKAVDFSQNIDGARATAREYDTVLDRNAFEAKLEFLFADDEALFGFGSHEEGYGNLRGKSRQLYQQNMKAVVPFFISTRGYGVLFDCSSLMSFHDDASGSYWSADVVEQLDYYVIHGDRFDVITRGYYQLTGMAPMLPKWAFGYVQSKERYVNAREMLDVVREYRRRRIPLDVIVLDWKSWPNGAGWGQKSFDPIRFPDPEGFTSELHAMNIHLMVSIWPIMTGGCEDQRELLDKGLMLGNQSTYDAFLTEARQRYWQQAQRGLFSKGVDAWWCDCTEPFEADWAGAVKPNSETRLAINTSESQLYLDPSQINAYSLFHSQGIFEGQRRVTTTKRVLNLTRSSYAGQHRYGTVTWNGDISATWETLRRCIPEGVNFCASGEPYWTVDVGGFFIDSNPDLWFWRGDYADGCRGLTDMNALEPNPHDIGCRDLGFWELYTRWMQYAVFLPMLRSHGTDAAREIWRFGDGGDPFYDVLARYIRFRYKLMPYIYSLAAQVTFSGRSMVRAVALDFPSDRATHNLVDQYLFGPALLVCPVTEPMYYDTGSRPLSVASKSRPVYLPLGPGWFDFWTGSFYPGGQLISADAALDTIPLFACAGSIVPLTEVMQYVGEVPDAPYEIRVYTGADADFELYEDEGDGYGYEHGLYAFVPLHWREDVGEFTLAARQGAFPGLVIEREYCIVFLSKFDREVQCVRYTGEALHIRATIVGRGEAKVQ
jgi:alpha-D-xyloside xylohydrolase